MRLTPAGKVLLFLVGLGVLGYAGWTYRGAMPGRSQRAAAAPPRPRRAPPAAAGRAPAAERKGVLASVRQTGVLRVGMEPDAPPCTSSTTASRTTASTSAWPASSPTASAPSACRSSRPTTRTCPTGCAPATSTSSWRGYVPDPSVDGVVWSNGYLDFGLCLIVTEGMAATYRSARTWRASASPSTTTRRPSAGCRRTSPAPASASSRATTAGSRRSNGTRPTRSSTTIRSPPRRSRRTRARSSCSTT